MTASKVVFWVDACNLHCRTTRQSIVTYVYHGLTHKLKTSIIRPYVSMTSIVLLSILRKSMRPINCLLLTLLKCVCFYVIKKTNSYRFGTAYGRVNDRISIFGWMNLYELLSSLQQKKNTITQFQKLPCSKKNSVHSVTDLTTFISMTNLALILRTMAEE